MDVIKKSRHLAYLLRHDKEAFEGGRIDKHGWRKVSELVKLGYNRQVLDEVVDTNNKRRYEYSPNREMIRAKQGHSIPVDVDLLEMTPPNVLYHGTATKFIESINKNGLLSETRLYVHLSQDEKTAMDVGARHGDPFVIKIDCKKMVEDGCKFYLSKNGIWQTKIVLPKYFIHKPT